MSADQRIRDLAAAIADYLSRFPRSADTAEGIGQWWIAADVPPLASEVEAALELLEEQGTVEKIGIGNRFVFRARTRGN